jgi:hypothetical protein
VDAGRVHAVENRGQLGEDSVSEALDRAQRMARGDASVEVNEGEHAQLRIAPSAHRKPLPRRVHMNDPPAYAMADAE